jgi:hypothetical protein
MYVLEAVYILALDTDHEMRDYLGYNVSLKIFNPPFKTFESMPKSPNSRKTRGIFLLLF